MSRLLVHYLILATVLVQLNSEVYNDRPKIKTKDGDLILEPAYDKNIYLQTNGPRSTIFVGEVNLLNISTSRSNENYQPVPNDGVDALLNGRNGILQRLLKLESQNTVSSTDLKFNVSVISLITNRLMNKIHHLQNQLNNMAKEECKTRTCQNGGTCLNLVKGYHCLCPSNWEGRNCDIDVNECRNFVGTDLGCQNGALCINRPGTYECLCRSGWLGVHCTKKEKDCIGGNYEMCGHGTCVPVTSGEGIKCICDQGWTTNGTGVACLTDVNECDASQGPRCSTNPKVECINLPGSFRCGQCPPGYDGDGYSCYDINECQTIPNGGCSPMVACHNTIGSRICGNCPPGYQGDGVTCSWRGSCNVNHGGCHPSAQCIENLALTGTMAQCVCPEGMDGDGIGLNGCYVSVSTNVTKYCEDNPCGPNGQCHVLRSGYTCICYRGYTGAQCNTLRDYCATNPCQNGGLCRPDDTMPRGFRCECSALYTGTVCQVRARNCGGLLDSEEGSIVYPVSNYSNYEHNSKCAWVIHTVPSKVVNITFTKFHLELEPECRYDFLQMHDGPSSSSQLIGRFCGNKFPKGGNIISSHNNIYLWFRSDATVAKGGFSLHWNSIDPICGGEINATTHGHISSPGSPGKYPPNRDCYWHLITTYGKKIQLHFFEFDIESHPNCSYDYLAIYDGEHTTDPLLNKYCNSTQPAPIQSASSELLIHFHSDAFSSGNGFQIAFAPIDGVPGCGGYFTGEQGEITSPSYNGLYLNNLICEYKIRTSPDTKIKIEFNSFNLERSARCMYDYLKVYDGPSIDSRLVGKFCGSVNYPKSYISSSNFLFIKFKTDRSKSSEGFRITYKTICQNIITGDSGVLKSPGYPFNYPGNKVCEYIIATVPGKAIQLTFQDFDIEDSRYYNCQYDNIEIRDGPNINSTLRGKYCGGIENIPPTQISTHNFMYIRFNSDISVSGTGFYANFTTIDIECGGIYKQTTGLISFPSGDNVLYENNQKCTWILIAPEGTHIKLSWNKFDIEDMPSCDSDYLELFEIDENNKNETMGKYCGTTLPPAITTMTNHLVMKFVSDKSIRSTGFSVSYSYLNEKSHCGGTYVKTHGFITSPGWPNNYEPNRDCKWTIKVPAGQQIHLNISEFDLERSIRNKCDIGDYLEIRNGGTVSAPLIGKYCGHFNWKRIISTGHSLYLHFHSDFYMGGKGFKIEWDGTIQGCGGTLTSSSGSISSPNYPEIYAENAECYYKIISSHGSRISINFKELDLERTPRCRDDYVEIFNGRDANAESLGKFCYMSPAANIIETTSNIAFIKFRSDFYIGGKGFLLDYITKCQNNITGNYGIIESPDFPNDYPTNLNCLWTINVPKGNKINVTFTHFDVYKSHRNAYRHWWHTTHRPGCERDYVQLKELPQYGQATKFCGTSLPSALTTKGNMLQIKFVTGFFNFHSGFRLEWVKFGCGGRIQKAYGSFSKTVPSNEQLECEWIIETSTGSSVFLMLTKLYMIESQNCTTDSIEIYNGPDDRSPLISKICHKKDVTIQGSTNFILIRLIKQSSLKDVNFEVQYSSTSSVCGGLYNSPSGFISSKNYPKNYENSMDCTWSITVAEKHRIELNFIDLDLHSFSDYNMDTSCGDSIRLYDNMDISNANYTDIICPNSRVSQFISKGNTLLVQFISDSYGTAKGFKASFSQICGSTITATYEGVLTNDKIVNHSNISCTWTILAPTLYQKISLTITHMSLPYANEITNISCSLSYLRIYDGNNENAPLIDEYCGYRIPSVIVSHGSAITVQLGTHSDKIVGHFSAHYTALNSACGGYLTSEEGAIASPNYPRPYPVNADCEWTLKTSPGNKVYITFDAFNLAFSEECNEDYLEIRETNAGGRLLGVYCGDIVPMNTTVGSELFIKFHSDNKYGGQGFFIRYGFIHGNEIVDLQNGEIASPLYPFPYDRPGEYWWRITSGVDTISLTIDKLEIHTHEEDCYSSLTFYDGHDDEAPVLEKLCGLITEEKVLQTTSNAVYIKLKLLESNSGAIFHLRWTQGTKVTETDATTFNCGFNETKIIMPGQKIVFNSPNYPEEYDNNLNCQWVFKSIPGQQVALHFNDFEIEEIGNCFADSVSIYKSDNPTQWIPVKESVCTAVSVAQNLNSSMYLRVNFRTDASVTRKGFQAVAESKCGGVFTDLSGIFGPIISDYLNIYKPKIKCNWKVKVRPGRHIKLSFQHFNITNKDDDCKTFVILHNGDSIDAPLLSSGKYCGYSYENRSEIVTSGNTLFVTYETSFLRDPQKFQSFRLWYEEENINCGTFTELSLDHPWEVISSPNYPSIPDPYSECVWKFNGPPGEILKIDFIERFDLDYIEECPTEVIEVHDGLSNLAPLKGKFCGEKPATIKTSSNTLYIKYMTLLAEPRNGFKANISIDVCGGTVIGTEGQVTSPGYPNMAKLPTGTVCEWHLRGKPRHILFIKLNDINLPESESLCGTKITIEEDIPGDKTVNILKTFCSEDIDDSGSVVETSTNKVTIKLHVGKPSEYTVTGQSRGFLFTFNSSVPSCNGLITTPEGYLTTPGYPRETSIRQCQWRITVPNKRRRVKLEILDYIAHKQRIGVFNDKNFQTSIGYVSQSNTTANTTTTFESSGHELALYVWLNSYGETQRFKARFSSDEEALCGGTLHGKVGELISPDLDRSYSCYWHFDPESIVDFKNYSTLYITAKVNSSVTRSHCRYADPKLKIKATINNVYYDLTRDICGNTQVSYRLPVSVVDYIATKGQSESFYFDVQWKLKPCGGVIHAEDNAINVINLSNVPINDTIDCAWTIETPPGNRVEIKLDGTFLLECADEYIKILRNVAFLSNIGDYCKNKMQDSPITESFSKIVVEYHSGPKNYTDIKLMVKTTRHSCGAFLGAYERTFASPNFPNNYFNNQECSWEIKSELGYRISLSFVNRFGIESKPNCTKDAVIIYDWKNEMYTEIAKLCGRELPKISYNSTHNRMKVVLRTDNDINLYGFQAVWNPVCGGTFTADKNEQYLYSPGYPYSYTPYLDCTYNITKTSPDDMLSIKFLNFDVEGPYPNCDNDNVTVSSQGDYDYFYETYCGKHMPPLHLSNDDVTISFKTDAYLQRKGFKLAYSLFSCGGHVKEPKILTAIPFGNYHSNMNCTWIIEAPKDKIVSLTLLYIDIENNYLCDSDYLAVYDGLKIDYKKRLALICGHDNSTTALRSNGNTMVLQFVTDSSVQYNGFKANVLFSYSESVGCGGTINLTTTAPYTLKYPSIVSKVVYENFLDCHWRILAPPDYFIKIQFTSFHIAPCQNVNQTALGYSQCDCDYVEIKNGMNPDSYTIGTYCGHSLPPVLSSSSDGVGIRLYTDGEIVSSGFEASLSTFRSQCGQSLYNISYQPTTINSPGFRTGSIPRETRCDYHLLIDKNEYTPIHIRIKTLDLKPGTSATSCDKDKLVITSYKSIYNKRLGNDYILNGNADEFFVNSINYFMDMTIPEQITICGSKKMTDIYVSGSVTVHLETSSDYDSTMYRGFEMEVSLTGFCSRNYTDNQGRLKSTYYNAQVDKKDCYTLITAPENYTVSLYFLTVSPDYWNDNIYLDIYDGDKTSATKVVSIRTEYFNNPVFSTGRYLLLHSHQVDQNQVTYDVNYVVTNKGRGCGGRLFSDQGVVTSPLYPGIYRQKNTCEWELETPVGTRLGLHFSTFDLGADCENNYVALVNRQGNTISTYCSETPATYTSTDNYVKIVFFTTMNNGGTGWTAEFVSFI